MQNNRRLLALIGLVKKEGIKDIRAFDFSNPLVKASSISDLHEAIESTKKEKNEIKGFKGIKINSCEQGLSDWMPTHQNRIESGGNMINIPTVTSILRGGRFIIAGEVGDMFIFRVTSKNSKNLAIKKTRTELLAKIINQPISDTMLIETRLPTLFRQELSSNVGWRKALPHEKLIFEKATE